ncbi:cell wall [Fusarium albosuccineum]|uniref:Cell wall n=1 Tax=Fusarium albosuccineum TaxID=1237068 RepID=A0A8H4LFA5_9HYPO|nr:cell wall [Fusarium albosuccineum]
MQIKAILFAPLVAAGFASAAPQKSTTFEAISLRSASPIHFAGVQAYKSHLMLNVKDQKASCDKKSDNQATFNLIGDELYLYRKSATPQQLWVDRSGMGQGVLQYTTGAQPISKNGEKKGWGIDKNGNLNFKGEYFMACPNSKKAGGSWTVWLDTGLDKPGFNEGCLGFTARTIKTTTPNSCLYTQQQQ